MRRLHIFFCVLISVSISAQHEMRTESKKAIKSYDEGLKAYNLQEYALAKMYLKEAIEADKDFQNAYMVLAEVCWDMKDIEHAIDYYGKGIAIDSVFYPRALLNKAKLEVSIGRYTDAQTSFIAFLKLEPEDSKNYLQALAGIKQTKFALQSIENPVDFEPINLGANINSTHNDYWPSLSADGQKLVFTRMVERYDITTGNYLQEDFYVSILENGAWSIAKSVGSPLNTPDNEGAQSISADGRFMVYTVCNRRGVIGRCDLYYSRMENGEWTYPENMGVPINSVSKETQPSLNSDGTIIYFASDRPGGKGGLDIWKSMQKEDGTWNVPENLGDTINTPLDEMSPYIHHDGKTLFFSSNGHLGMGGMDLFRSQLDENNFWSPVMNLGYPINTYSDEIGMIVNSKGDIAYFSSDIDKSKGKDIYQFKLYREARPDEVSYMKGRVFDEITRQRLKARFELFDLADGSLVSKSVSDEQNGEFLVSIPTNRDYMLNVARKGYLFYSDNFTLRGVFHLDEPYLKDIPLKPLVSGQVIILKNIFFETDSYTLRPESKYELDKVIDFLKANPSIQVEISGHTDNVGGAQYNLQLSAQRAESVVTYLISGGVNKTRLTYKGYGYDMPVDSNDTSEGRANNRRTELKIVD
jgi:outer membrane protein OmpA-like peptidoglycan-associated protein